MLFFFFCFALELQHVPSGVVTIHVVRTQSSYLVRFSIFDTARMVSTRLRLGLFSVFFGAKNFEFHERGNEKRWKNTYAYWIVLK